MFFIFYEIYWNVGIYIFYEWDKYFFELEDFITLYYYWTRIFELWSLILLFLIKDKEFYNSLISTFILFLSSSFLNFLLPYKLLLLNEGLKEKSMIWSFY